MKKVHTFKLLLSLLLCAVLLASPLTVLADSGSATIGISSKQLTAKGEFVSATTFDVTKESGKFVYIPVSISSSVKVGGVVFTLEYDKSVLEFLPGSSVWLPGNNAALSVYETEKGAMVNWEADPVQMDGEIYYAAFRAKEILQDTTAAVKLTVRQLLQGNENQEDISYSSASKEVTVNLVTTPLSASFLAAFEKLETIIYPNSSADIAAANGTFRNLTDYQKKQLKQLHPQAYEWYQTAQSRYNRLADAAAEQAVTDEIAAFETAYAAALALTPEQAAVENETAVQAAQDAMAAMSDRAKVLMEKKHKDTLEAVMAKIQERKDTAQEAEKETADYNERYGSLYALDKDAVEEDPTSYATMLNEALAVYNTLGDPAKLVLKEKAEIFTELREYCDEILSSDAAQAALMKEVSEYQGVWTDVLLLNAFTVSKSDETALILALNAYDRLSDGAQELLAARAANMEKMLLLIEEMDSTIPSEPATVPGETVYLPGETVYIPGETVTVPGETVTVPGETVIVPGETVIVPGETVTVPGETVTVPGETVAVPGETVIVPGETVTVPGETVTVPGPTQIVEQEKSVYKTKTNPAFLIVLIVLLVITLVSFALPLVLLMLGKKKKGKETVAEEETYE